MDKEHIKRKQPQRKTILLNIRISPEISTWLKEQNYSPTGIFYEALKDLGCPNA